MKRLDILEIDTQNIVHYLFIKMQRQLSKEKFIYSTYGPGPIQLQYIPQNLGKN